MIIRRQGGQITQNFDSMLQLLLVVRLKMPARGGNARRDGQPDSKPIIPYNRTLGKINPVDIAQIDHANFFELEHIEGFLKAGQNIGAERFRPPGVRL